jgi:hypothetical protein
MIAPSVPSTKISSKPSGAWAAAIAGRSSPPVVVILMLVMLAMVVMASANDAGQLVSTISPGSDDTSMPLSP